MKTVVCYKYVPSEDSISVERDRTLRIGKDAWEIGMYDLRAIEAAVQLASGNDEVYALTVGGEIIDNSKMRKAVLSRGPHQMLGIKLDTQKGSDTLAVAKLLAAGVEKIGDVGLVICGEGSGDEYTQQTGNLVGAILGWNVVNAVSDISVEGDKLIISRSLEDCVEVLELGMPAVLSVTADINTPRIPTMKEILGAGKKPVTVVSASELCPELAPASEMVSILAPEQADRKRLMFDAASEVGLAEFISILKNNL